MVEGDVGERQGSGARGMGVQGWGGAGGMVWALLTRALR